MSEAQTRFNGGASPVGAFLTLRETIRETRTGGGGHEVCAALTGSLDDAITELVSGLDTDAPFAVVALGGFGRAELSLYSDVDIMVLHEVDDPSEIAAAVFRPLWDAGLRLGHAVRTVKESAEAAREGFATHTTLLTSRLVVGDSDLFARLTGEVAKVTRARPLRRHLIAQEQDRRRTQPYLLMATDVKAGRGGLRTLQGFQWERKREALIGRFSPPSSPEETAAHEDLLAIRNALHATSGRPYDVFTPELREAVSRWLGKDVRDTAAMLVSATRVVDDLAGLRWPEAVETQDAVSRTARKFWQRLRKRPDSPVTRSLSSAGDLVALLRSGEQGRLAMTQLEESGALSELLPEWSVVRAEPQLAPFHEHPVDAHLWRAADEMLELIGGDDRHYRDIAEEIGSDETLMLAAFLHDIGKGQGGDHSQHGAEIARSVCMRLRCPPEITELVVGAVRHHLLLSQTATRRDLDDPAVIAEVAGVVGSLRLLQVLYLLTVADARATGATMWNEWKATLVRALFLRCAVHFGADRPTAEVGGATLEDILGMTGKQRREEVEQHLAAMPEDYLRSASTDDVLWHLEMLRMGTDGAQLGVRPGDGADTAVVIGARRPGLRGVVAAVFAANGIDVLEARMLSREDGVVIDTFRVRDDRTGGSVSEPKWKQTTEDLKAAITGELDTNSKLAARAAAYASEQVPGFPLEVDASIDPASEDAVITIHCSDRVGRLAEILSAIYQAGLEISLAKLDSRSGEVIDSFYVRKDGESVPGDLLDALEEAIAVSIEP